MKFLLLAALALVVRPLPRQMSLNDWIAQQTTISVSHLLANMTVADGLPGATIASPQKDSPNYYFHWVRDSALAHLTAVRLYRESTGAEKNLWKQHLLDFASFSGQLQTSADLGEPKFYVNGQPYTIPGADRSPTDRPCARSR